MSNGSFASREPIDILLVEDNPGDIQLTQEAFDDGCTETTVHVVTDGVEALDFLHQRGGYNDAPRPAIVLLDLNLPRLNGDKVLDEVKNDPELRDIPIIILTSSKSKEDIIKSYDRYANAYLTKPVDPFEFMKKVSQFGKFWLSNVKLPVTCT